MNAKNPDEAFLNKCVYDHIPRLETILKLKSFDRVILALGTNSLADSSTNKYYSQLLDQISENGGAKCDWIGPPHYDVKKAFGRHKDAATYERHLNDFYTSLEHTIKNKCALHDSRDFTANPAPDDTFFDGLHRTKKSCEKWTKGTFNQLFPALGPRAETKPSEAAVN